MNRTIGKQIGFACIVMLAACASAAHAATVRLGYDYSAITNSSRGSSFSTGIGLRFTANSNFTIDGLGTATYINGASGSTHAVSSGVTLTIQLFDVSANSVLGTVTFSGTDLGNRITTLPFNGYAFYKTLGTSINVVAGHQYEIVAYGYSTNTQYLQNTVTNSMASFGETIDPLITHNGSYYTTGGVGHLATTFDASGVKYAGPTFSILTIPTPAALPAGLALLACAGLFRPRYA